MLSLPPLLILSAALQSPPVPHSIETSIVESRTSISSLEAHVETKFDFPRMGPPQVWKSHIWIDGDNAREDRLLVHESKSEENIPREIRCSTPDELLYWKTDEVPGHVGIAVHRWRNSELVRARENHPLRFPRDPRLLGVSFMNTRTLTVNCDWETHSAIGMPDRHDQHSEEVVVDGRTLLLVTFEMSTGTSVSFWLDPEIGGQPIRMHATDSASDIECSITTDYQIAPDGATWFPARVVAEQLIDGVKDWSEEVNVTLVSVNEPIAPDLFTLAGMNIPQKSIQDYPKPETQTYWDGNTEQTGSKAPETNPKTPPAVPGHHGRRTILLVNLCVVLVLALYFGLRRKS